jgi:hypothetical protein
LCFVADFSALDKYLNLPETQKKLGVPKGRKYVITFSLDVHKAFACASNAQLVTYEGARSLVHDQVMQ